MAAASAERLSPARTMRIAESLYMDGYISYPRVDNTVYPSSLDLADTVKAISGNPAYAPYCKELLAKASSRPRAARRRRLPTTRPSTRPPRPRPTIWLPPTTSCTPHRAPLPGDAVRGGRHRGHEGRPRRERPSRSWRRATFWRSRGLPRHLPLRPQERRAAARAFRGRDHRVQRRHLHEEADRAARALQPGQADPGDGEAGLGTKSTRHAPVERPYAVKYCVNDPIEPSQLGMAVCDALTSSRRTSRTPR